MHKLVFTAFVLILTCTTGCRGLFMRDHALPATGATDAHSSFVKIIPGNYKSLMKHNGLNRTFRFYIPRSCTFKREQPLVFLLHGGGGRGLGMENLTQHGFNELSEIEGFIPVYPDGYGKRWNDGRKENIVDDVGFITTLIDYFDNKFNIDRKRVYSSGISNGSFMSYRLALDAPDKFAAIAPVVGCMSENQSKLIPREPVPVLAIIGTDDPMIPWKGGLITVLFWSRFGKSISAEDTIKYWVKHNKCFPKAEESLLPDIDPCDGTRVRVKTFKPMPGGKPVIFYTIEHCGHTWPGGRQYGGKWLIGKTCRDIDANKVIWEFFKKHKLGDR